MIGIVNYGLGNLGSIQNMLKRVGCDSFITDKPEEIARATKIILPGVGAFDTGMQHLVDNGWIEPLNKKVLQDKVPTLGICLGMQLMTRSSEEGKLPGLGWIAGDVIRFTNPQIKVPHMGWNIVKPVKPFSVLDSQRDELKFYFVHSYYVKIDSEENLLGTTMYGTTFASAFVKDNIVGVQFHPEKSHKFGMDLLTNFSKL
jgi:imidazole glycerol-phosphate synthase subunit HisH